MLSPTVEEQMTMTITLCTQGPLTASIKGGQWMHQWSTQVAYCSAPDILTCAVAKGLETHFALIKVWPMQHDIACTGCRA